MGSERVDTSRRAVEAEARRVKGMKLPAGFNQCALSDLADMALALLDEKEEALSRTPTDAAEGSETVRRQTGGEQHGD